MRDPDIDELQRIWDLKQKGAISEGEYLQLKADLLASSDTGRPDPTAHQPTQTAQNEDQDPFVTDTPSPDAPPRGPSYPKIAGVSCLVLIVLYVIIALVGTNTSVTDQNSAGGVQTGNETQASPLTPRERKRQIQRTLAELKRVPATDYARNNELYSKLFELDPSNSSYDKMRHRYQDKIENQNMSRQTAIMNEQEFEANPENALSITNFHGSKEGFGTVLYVSFIVKNAASFPIKDFEVTCKHSAQSGTIMDDNTRTIYEVVPANGSKSIRNFDMGFIDSQATHSSCVVTDAVKA